MAYMVESSHMGQGPFLSGPLYCALSLDRKQLGGQWPWCECGGESGREAAGSPHTRRSKQYFSTAAVAGNTAGSLYIFVLNK